MALNAKFLLLLRIYWIGLFFNQLLPSSFGGDVAKVALAKKLNLSFGAIASSLVVERALGISVLSFMAFFFGLGVATNKLNFGPLAMTMLVIGPFVGLICLLGILHTIKKTKSQNKYALFLVETSSRVTKFLSQAQQKKIELTKVILLTALSHFLVLLIPLIAVYFMTGRDDIDSYAILAVGSIAMIIAALPISISGWGVREVAFAGGMSSFGLDFEVGVSASLVLGVVMLIWSLPGAFLWFDLQTKRAS